MIDFRSMCTSEKAICENNSSLESYFYHDNIIKLKNKDAFILFDTLGIDVMNLHVKPLDIDIMSKSINAP